MADTKISDMSPAAALAGSELIPAVQAGGNVVITPDDIKTYIEPVIGPSSSVDGALAVFDGVDGQKLKEGDISLIIDGLGTSDQGAILFRGEGYWGILPPGDAGYVLTTNGAGEDPEWSPAGSGDVVGPAGATDGGIVLFNGTTGKVIKAGTLTQLLDLVGSAAQGDILYRNGSDWVRLAASTAGFHLQTNGASNNPTWEAPIQCIAVACSDETTALTTGNGKITFRMPYKFTLTAVRASLTTAQTSGSTFTVDINESGSTILSTKLTIDNTEKTSTTAATAPVISDAVLADDAEMSVDLDQIGDGTAKGLKVYLIGYKTP